jgi:5-(carboxyamino)imidazole ribonucleotide synthase
VTGDGGSAVPGDGGSATFPAGPCPRVGIVGGGQLGRMLALAGRPLGLRFRFLEPGQDPPVGELGPVERAGYDDPEALERFARDLEVVTYEFENVPVEAARTLARRLPVHPAPRALEVAQDRAVEKETFRSLGIPVAPFRRVDTREELQAAVDDLGLPAVLKTRRFGYDGKGQVVLERTADLEVAWEQLGGRPLILEAFVSFRRELSCLVVRSTTGETRAWPLVENRHRDGILRTSRASVDGAGAEELQAAAEGYVGRLLDELGYAGVLAVEFFDTGKGLLANEMAPRVHNSGHWTQDGARTCQFENHLRGILGLPLGPTALREGWAGMVNLIGGIPPRERILEVPGARLHLYDKAPRPGRKVGHVNLAAGSREELEDGMARLTALAEEAGEG